jgi:four helix bundle protein
MKTYRHLEVWQRAMMLAEAVYLLTRTFPAEERYGLTSQMRRAAVSVPSNIAEGYGRSHRGDYVHSLSYARGSLVELQTQLILAGRLQYVSKVSAGAAWIQSEIVAKMLTRLMMRLTREYPVRPDPRPLAPDPDPLTPPGDK